MLRNTMQQLIDGALSRRAFLGALAKVGVGTIAASQLADMAIASEDDPDSLGLENVTGGEITCETLRLWDVPYVFGNTGAYEAGFVDALVDYDDIHYVLGLQEGSVMAMADGYSRTSGQTAFVNIHSITGTANALGLIVNAWADNSAVVVSVGLSENSGENLGVFTETDKLEAIPELYTKLSFRATQIQNLGESLRRAFRLATVLPSGPVFIGIPADIWKNKLSATELLPAHRTISKRHVHPDADSVEKAAALLVGAKNPLLIAGAELPRWGGLAELASISEQLGAVVSGDTSSSRSSMGFPTEHPRYLGAMRRPIQADTPFDVVLLAGASRLSLARGAHPLIPREAKIIEIGQREDHLARSYPADILMYAHAGTALAQLHSKIAVLDKNTSSVTRLDATARDLHQQRLDRLQQTLESVWETTPIAPERLAHEVDRHIAKDAVVVTEGVSSDGAIWDYVKFDQPGGGRQHQISSGGSLGWGVGAAIGCKLGAPDKQVVCMLGDGSYQFGTQALWTAKRFEVPMIIVIFNNLGYQANRWALAGMKSRAATTGKFIGVSLDDPRIDHVGIAKSYGHDGEVVADPSDIGAALDRAISAEKRGQLYLLDVLVDQRGGGAGTTWHEKYVPEFSS